MRDYELHPMTPAESRRWQKIESVVMFFAVTLLGTGLLAIFFYGWTGMPSAAHIAGYYAISLVLYLTRKRL